MKTTGNPSSPTAALGVAGVMGCFMAAFALASLLIGVALDRALGGGKIATLVCVLVGLPLNLGIAVWLTRQIIARIIPDTRRTGFTPTAEAGEDTHDAPAE